MGQNSCQPEGLQPESALAALLVLAIERLLPSPGALPSPILAATHTCFIVLGTLGQRRKAKNLAHARCTLERTTLRSSFNVDIGGLHDLLPAGNFLPKLRREFGRRIGDGLEAGGGVAFARRGRAQHFHDFGVNLRDDGRGCPPGTIIPYHTTNS